MGCAFDKCLKEKAKDEESKAKEDEKGEKGIIDHMYNITETNTVASQDEEISTTNKLKINASTIVIAKQGLPSDYYEKLQLLGEGSYGMVYKVKLKGTNEIRALKVIQRHILNEELSLNEIENEVKILKRIDHPNVVKVFETFNDEDNFYITYELCSEGTLLEKLEKLEYSINESLVKRLMYQILSAVAYLHSQKIIHGDLKLENILIDSLRSRHTSFATAVKSDLKELAKEANGKIDKFKNASDFEIKLIDFGCSKIFSNKNTQFKDTIGTLYYIAPEVIKEKYTEKCDIWSCGIIMYLLLSGHYPFYSESDQEVQKLILSGKVNFDHPEFSKVSKPAKDVIKYLLTYDPNQRPTAELALKHSFFTLQRTHNSFNFHDDESKIILTNLKNITGHGRFREAVLTFITHNFCNKDDIYRLKKTFKYIDKNSDGRISKEEMLNAYKELGMDLNIKELERILQIMDADNSGFIEYEEFIRATINKNKILTDENLKLAFDLFDLDKNGTISCGEIKKILSCERNLSDEVFDELLKELNKKAEDEIGFDEFKKIICNV